MALIKWKDLPSTDTPLNATNLNFNFNEVLNLIYPIGRVIIDETDTDYSNYLGFTWERTLVGVVPVGKDAGQTEFSKLGKTGGEKTHKLTETEMPSHRHNGLEWGLTGRKFIYSGAFNGSDSIFDLSKGGIDKRDDCNYAGTNHFVTEATGGNQPHNNLQPYKVVNYWKRIS